jgi:cytidylate kinase
MGTTVFPTSILKVFLTASAEARARRRCVQLQGLGENVSLPRLTEAIQERDARDRHRESSPLLPAEDAVLIDSTHLSAHDVYRAVWKLVVSRGLVAETLESRLDPARAKIF